MRHTKLVLVVLVLAAVSFTGCLKNPVTGRIGPSWDIPLEVPLISGEITVQDWASDLLPEDFDPEQPLVLEFNESIQVDVTELGETAGLPLDGFSMEAELLEDEFEGDFGDIDVEIEIEVNLNMADFETDIEFTSISFAQGLLSLTFEGITPGSLEISSITIGDAELEGEDNTFIVDGITVERDAALKLQGTLTEIGFESVTMLAEFSNVKFDQLVFVVDEQELAADELGMEPVEFGIDFGDLAEVFEWISDMEALLIVEVDNPSGIPMDLGGLQLKITGQGGEDNFINFADAEVDVEGTVTTYTISPANIMEIFRSEPQTVALDGTFQVGSAEAVVIDPNTEITLSVSMTAETVFTIDYDQDFEDWILRTTEVAQQDELEKGLEFISKPALFAEVSNGLPVGVELWLDMSQDENDWNDAVSLDLGLISAAEVDDSGRAVKPRTGLLELPVNDEVQDFLKKGGFIRVRTKLATEGKSGTEQLVITPSDAVEYRIWAEVSVKVNQ